ncbi:dihydroorotase [Streptomyces californicus]
MTMSKILIRGARVLGGEPQDVLIDGETTAEVGTGLDAGDATVIEAEGRILLPGLVDLHTHLREPGREDSETVLTGTRAAAVGGFTAVHAMANTFPVADTAGVVEQVWRLGRESGYCDVQPVGAVTVGLEGKQLAELGAMHDSAAGVKVFSDDGKCVDDAVIMRRALEYVKAFDGIILRHQPGAPPHRGRPDERGRRLRRTRARRLARRRRGVDHRPRRPPRRPRRLPRIHICHLSTAGSVEIVRWAKSKGWNITAEVTPHHLLLTDELVRTYNPVYKVNPPLRTEADVLALREALADGTIDCVATDHAPHPHEDKDCEWAAAAMGMVGLETALSVVQQTMVDTGLIDWAGVADRMSFRPAAIGRLAGHGRPVSAGEPADLHAGRSGIPWSRGPRGLRVPQPQHPLRGP